MKELKNGSKRKSISKKIRFEVFKRDNFKCQYCGNGSPDVVLHVDHIKPVADGGTNNIMNLITSCFDCNSGKGATLLNDKSILEKQKKQLEELNEKREQLQMMMEWRDGLLKIEQDKTDYAVKKFSSLAKCDLKNTGRMALEKQIKKYGLDLVLESIEISCNQYLESDGDYFTDESIEKAFGYVEKICVVKSNSKDKPYLKELFYARAILKNRLHYYNPHLSIQWLEKLYLNGYSTETLINLCKEVRNWSEFQSLVNQCLEDDEDA